PEQWREVFLMKAVDGWHPDDIAAYEGLDPQQVTWQVAMSREFLRSWIDEARANGEPVAEQSTSLSTTPWSTRDRSIPGAMLSGDGHLSGEGCPLRTGAIYRAPLDTRGVGQGAINRART